MGKAKPDCQLKSAAKIKGFFVRITNLLQGSFVYRGRPILYEPVFFVNERCLSMSRIFIFLALALPLLLTTGVVIHVIGGIPEALPGAANRSQESGGTLEAGALVDTGELGDYLLFAGESRESIGEWVKNMGTQNRLLPPLLANDCFQIYCYQHRMVFERIPSVFWKVLLGVEDYRFPEHRGVDPRSILRALLANIKKGKTVQGGSTLTQQLAKNLYYSADKNLWRKIKEAIASIYLELKYSKEKILEAYFNEVTWGYLQGIRLKGIHAASLFYFAKHPREIDVYEASILVSLLKGPGHFHPLRHTRRLMKRTDMVLGKLRTLNLVGKKDVVVWSASLWEKWFASLRKRERLSRGRAIWKTLGTSGFGQFERFVFITKAMKIQRQIKERYPEADISVKSVIGNLADGVSFDYYSKYERDTQNALVRERHQVGSVVKPLLYSLFFKLGVDPESRVSLAPLTLRLKSGEWTPREVAKNPPKEAGALESLLRSYNRPVIRLAQEVGFAALEEAMEKELPRLKKPLGEYPAQLLGAMELSLGEVFDLYRRFIRQGCQEGDPVIGDIVRALSVPENTTVRRSLGPVIGLHKFFGKTGTSNRGLDNWYVFFDGEMLGVIHLGHEGVRKGVELDIYGGGTAFVLFRDFVRDRGRRFNELSCL